MDKDNYINKIKGEEIKINIIFLGLAFAFVFMTRDKYLLISGNSVFFILMVLSSLYYFVVKQYNLRINFGMLLAVTSIFISVVQALHASERFDSGYFFSFILILSVYIMVNSFEINIREVRYLISCLIFSIIIISLIIIIFKVDYYDGNTGRFTIRIINSDTYVDPNHLGGFLASFSMFPLIRLINERSKRKKIIYSAICICVIIATLMTGSRGAMISLAINIIFITIHYLINSRGFKIFNYKFIIITIGIGILMFISVKYLPDSSFNRLFVNDYADGGNALRVTHWLSAIDCIKISPLTGYGLVNPYDILATYSFAGQAVHNTYLEIILQYGLLGSLPFIFIIVRNILFCIKKENVFLLGFSISMLFNCVLIGASLTVTFWGAIIITTILMNFSRRNKDMNISKLL
ncbi:lipid A core-O-antigen ligase-like enyme [Clostridium paraputrificum]|uniref:O-antigen ligase family protein n=1 Tax=Clostridium paraputrificum TaxID=29363 RepID=UPI0006C03E5E|nr:O-antigen ligase family protein [Clostridium paraputrificum]CUQ42764.1 lipid A core-O-antigen ligase-like enyme [Clostridium paraputrificum]